MANGRESADALQKSRRGGAGRSHLRGHAHKPCRKRVRKQRRRPAGGRSQPLQSRYEGVARRRCQSREREGCEEEQGSQQEGENCIETKNCSQLVQPQDRTGPPSEGRPRSPHSSALRKIPGVKEASRLQVQLRGWTLGQFSPVAGAVGTEEMPSFRCEIETPKFP